MNLKNCILSFLKTVDALRERKICDLTGVEICDSGYKTGNEPPKNGWRAYNVDQPLVGDDAHFWLRASLCTPSIGEREYLVLRTETGREGLWDATNPQGLLYLNGKMVQGLDTNHTDAYLEPDTDYTLHNYFHMGTHRGGEVRCKMSLVAIDRDVEHLYYDIKVPDETCNIIDSGSSEYAKMMSVLVDATRIVDLRDPASERFSDSVREAIDFMEREFYGKLCTVEGKPIVHCIGHTHIDVEWQWARAQTREKIQRSFSTAKALMGKYPEYKFLLSQPELYRYLMEEAPEKFEELKELISEGRWAPEGAMYLEPDCNLTSGESLVRQLIYGKRFFREKLGVDSKVLFLPDVFGYSAALPQILKKSGVDYFVTSKISWNDTNTMPMDMFYWQGIDGTEIFTSFMTAQPLGGMYGSPSFTTYNSMIEPTYVIGTWKRFAQKEYTNNVYMTYGFGDGGGGPTKDMLEMQRRTARGIPTLPVTVTNTLVPYLKTARADFDSTAQRTGRTPRWVGELYLEYHRGTYTSIAKVKRGNRYSEFLLGNTEALSVTDLALGGSYDAEGLNENWLKVLHNQFHDILPGSSIGEVYDGTDKDYAEIAEYGEGVVDAKLSAIADRLSTAGGVLVYNPTGFERVAVVRECGYTETDNTVPPYGWTVVKNTVSTPKVSVKGLVAENKYYVLKLNATGEIESLYDKRAEREVLAGVGNRLVAYEDNPTKYDAWELEDYYKLKAYEIGGVRSITPIKDGTRAGFVIEREYMHSTIKQTIWLYSACERIDLETNIDWHEHHQIVKALFPLDVHSMSATFEVQYGHLTRPTHQNTSWECAKFESYAHKWVDVSEHGYGVAILNDSKYGHSVDGSTVGITLLKSATSPNPDADQGEHSFTYSIYPHIGDFREGGVIKEGYLLNQPLYEKKIGKSSGNLPERYSFVSVDKESAVITAVKKSEEGEDLIVRFYDSYDTRSAVTVSVPCEYRAVYLCDLLENEIEELDLNNGKVSVAVGNFEIVTLKFKK